VPLVRPNLVTVGVFLSSPAILAKDWLLVSDVDGHLTVDHAMLIKANQAMGRARFGAVLSRACKLAEDQKPEILAVGRTRGTVRTRAQGGADLSALGRARSGV